MNNCIKLHVFLRWGIDIVNFWIKVANNYLLFESAVKINIIIHGSYRYCVEDCGGTPLIRSPMRQKNLAFIMRWLYLQGFLYKKMYGQFGRAAKIKWP